MIKNFLFVLAVIFGLIFLFTDYGKRIDNYFTSFKTSSERTAEKAPPPIGKVIEGDPEDFYPLSQGKSWRYAATHATKGQGKLTITNLSQQTIKDKITVPRQYEFDNGGVFLSYIIYIVKDPGDIYQFAKGSSLNSEPHIYEPVDLVREPLQVGSNWKRTNTTGIVEGIDEKITVPAGTFEGCVKIKTTFSGGAQTRQWFAPRVGMVKMNYKYPDEKRNSELLLESYK